MLKLKVFYFTILLKIIEGHVSFKSCAQSNCNHIPYSNHIPTKSTEPNSMYLKNKQNFDSVDT